MAANEPRIMADLRTTTGWDLTVARGDPVYLTLALFHETAILNGVRGDELVQHVISLDRRLATGGIGEAEYRRQVDSAQDQLAAIISTPYYFGTQETPWSDSVKFYAEAHGAWQAIAWPLKPVDGPGEFSLKVDGETRWIIDFDVNPEDAESITAGRYRVKALMTASTADGTCSVEVESNMVTIDISGQPAPQTNERLLQLAWYHGNKGEYELQLEYARQVLRRHPDLPIALFFEGEAEAGRGNHTEALRAYTAALHEFDRQHPDSFERPELVVQRIVEVRHKLAPRGS